MSRNKRSQATASRFYPVKGGLALERGGNRFWACEAKHMCLALYPSLTYARPKLGSQAQLGSPGFRRPIEIEPQEERGSVHPDIEKSN